MTLAGLLALPLGACSTLDSLNPWSDNKEAPKEDVANVPVEELYNRGVDSMQRDNYDTAVKQFDLVEQNYPYSNWAVSAQIMQGYAEYLRAHYTDAVGVLDRFIQLHPTNRDIAYVYYLRALCFYEQIADIRRDQKGTVDAMTALQEVVNRSPDTSYGRDARLKIDLARDHLAGKEMEVGRFYQNQHLYEAAIGRFQRVIDDYQTTNHAPEALHRLTEIYLTLGLVPEARRTAAVLGYNYPGSPWYTDSYKDLVGDEAAAAAIAASDTAPPPPPRRSFFQRTFGSIF